MAAEKAIIWDFGGVLIDWNPDYLYRKLIPDAAARTAFLRDVCNGAWNQEQDRGRDWDVAIAERVALYPQHEELIRAYRARWLEMFSGPIRETVAILDETKARGHRAFGLTNWHHETLPLARHMLPWDRFEGVVVSGEVKLIKPDPAIFRHLLERYGLQAGQCLFIDDMAYNTAAAAALGFDAITFSSPAALRIALQQRGVI